MGYARPIVVDPRQNFDGGTVTASSEVGEAVVGNLQKEPIDLVWRSGTLAPSPAVEWFQVDFGETVTSNCLAMAAHNLTDSAMIRILASATGAFAGEEVEALGWTEISETWWGFGDGGFGEHGFGGVPSADEFPETDRLFYVEYPDVLYRYIRVEIDDADNPDTYVEIGRAAVDQRIEFPIYSYGYKVQTEDPSIRSRTDGGQFATAARRTYTVVELPFKRTEPAEWWLDLDIFIQRVRLVYGFFLLLDFRDDSPPWTRRARWFGRLDKMPTYVQGGPRNGAWLFTFQSSR